MTATLLPDLGGPLRRAVSSAVDALVAGSSEGLDAFGRAVTAPVRGLEGLLAFVAPEPAAVAVGVIAYMVTRRVRFAAGMAALVLGLGLLGIWEQAMQTLALVLTSVAIVAAAGLPLGIAAAKLPRLGLVLRPIYDLMQTVPSFVYLIPVAMLLGLGRAPALIATVIYALPPFARLTELGIADVGRGQREAARALGLRRLQTLWLIELPLARATILQGLNQAIMMALAMVVVASMIGARGLGETVLLGLQRADAGQGAVGGLAIVLLAVLLDRMTGALLGRRGDRPHK